MEYNPYIHKRHNMRLKNYDYSTEGYYFVTICIKDKQPLLGKIVLGKVILNEAGNMMKKVWEGLSGYCNSISMDIYTIMPDHIHGIIALSVGAGLCARPMRIKLRDFKKISTKINPFW